MKLNPTNVDPLRLRKPTSAAKQLKVHPSMITHWMEGGTLDFVLIDDVKFIPVESIAVLDAMRVKKAEEKATRIASVETREAISV